MTISRAQQGTCPKMGLTRAVLSPKHCVTGKAKRDKQREESEGDTIVISSTQIGIKTGIVNHDTG
jgi:hypothetical protein